MRTRIVHQTPGRVRFAVHTDAPEENAFAHLRQAIARVSPSFELTYSRHSRRYLVKFEPGTPVVEAIRDAATSLDDGEPVETERAPRMRAAGGRFEVVNKPHVAVLRLLAPKIARFLTMRAITPPVVAPITTAIAVAPYLAKGLRDARERKLSVGLLDATAIVASLAMRDLRTAQSIAFLLDLGETLEDWTRDRTRRNLAAVFKGDDQPAWVMRDGSEICIEASELRVGDVVIVRAGSRIPVDGVVRAGEALVNQASMTGESQAVRKALGITVYAGTVVEEGHLFIDSEKVGPETRFANIVRILESASGFEAEVENEAEQLAERAVPYTFGLAGLVYALTRNAARAASVLVVDFSCAIKLATPLTVKSAMLETAARGAVFKGGQHLERLAKVDAFVLDKTGTLTQACPRVAGVFPVNGYDEDYVLRNAACLEEHFPHPVATAVVRAALERGLHHEERHAEVDYIVAHGIASTLEGDRVLVGSRHFVEDDEGIDIAPASEVVDTLAVEGKSALFFAVAGKLAGVIGIEDPILEEAPAMIAALREAGVRRILMLTGDNQQSARTVAKQLGIDEVHAEMLPDEKTRVVQRLQDEGYTVAVVGDGMNDSAALACADIGISVHHGADVAREACDILMLDGQIDALPQAVTAAKRAMSRVRQNVWASFSANSAFMALGLTGLAPAALLALLHNASTVATCAYAMRPLLEPLEPLEPL